MIDAATYSIANTYKYDAYGNQESISAEDTNPFRYSGEYYDYETGFIYLRARYYDSTTGRFISEDPARDGANWYAYCAGNPVMYVDPLGLDAWLIHGTNLDNNPEPEKTWTKDFRGYLEEEVLNVGEKTHTPKWSGGNDKESREQAAKEIADAIITHNQNYPDDPVRLIGHSHGGNVAIMVANLLAKEGIKVETLVTIATPVREYQLDKGVTVGQHINVYNNSDQVQVRGGPAVLQIGAVLSDGVFGTSAKRTFSNATNINAKDAGKWYNPIASHSSMHSSKSIWEKYIKPAFKEYMGEDQ